MKSIFKHISAYSLILLLAMNSSYIDFNKMVCLITGRVMYSMDDIDDCSPKSDCSSYSQKCCDIFKIVLDFDYQSIVHQVSIDFDWTLLPLFSSIISETNVFVEDIQFIFGSDTSPPPLSGIQRLIFIQLFRL